MKKLLLLCSCLAIFACAKEEKVRLVGKRISIKPEQTQLVPDVALSEMKVIVPRQIEYLDWPQIGGFADHSPIHPKLAKNIHKKWEKSIGKSLKSHQSYTATPVVYNGVLYTINTESQIIALNAKTGKKLWDLELKSSLKRSQVVTPGALAIDGEKIVAVLGNGELYVINSINQKIIWQKQMLEPVRSAPVIKDGLVLINSLNNQLSTFNLETGELLWTHQGLSESLTILGDASPAISQNIVITTYSNGEIYALDITTGGEIWSATLANRNNSFDLTETILDVVASPVIVGNLVHIVNYNGKLSTFNLKTGKKYWTRFVSSVNTPWVAGNCIFIVGENGTLAAVYRKTGQVKWLVNLNELMHTSLNQKDLKNASFTSPFLAGNRLIIASNKGYAASFKPQDGSIDKIVRLKESVTVSPIVANNTLYFLTDNSNIIAYK